MMLGRVFTAFSVSAVAIALACGCASSSKDANKRTAKSNIPDPAPDPPGRKTAPITTTDPCAERLHALCGPLLYYYALNRRLPERLEDLRTIGGPEPDIELTCPVSGRQYVYDPQGLPRPGKPGVLVLYDAAPSHSGMRWAVAVEAPRPGQPLIPQVVAEPELTFRVPPGAAAPQP